MYSAIVTVFLIRSHTFFPFPFSWLFLFHDFFSLLGTFGKLRKNFIVFFQNLGKNWKKILYSLYLLTPWSPGAQILWACTSWCELSEYAIKIKMTYFRARAWRYSSSREKSEAVRPSKNFDDFQKSQIDGECRFLFFRKKSTFWVKIFPTSTDLASLGLLNSILWLLASLGLR